MEDISAGRSNVEEEEDCEDIKIDVDELENMKLFSSEYPGLKKEEEEGKLFCSQVGLFYAYIFIIFLLP